MIKYAGKASRFENEKIKMMGKMNCPLEMETSTSYFCVGLSEKTVYVTKEFHEKTMRFGTSEAMTMWQLNAQYPTFVMKELY